MPIKHRTLCPDDPINYTERELYDMYIDQGVSHADAKVAARQCYLMIQRLNQQEIRLWKNIKNNETTNWAIDFEE